MDIKVLEKSKVLIPVFLGNQQLPAGDQLKVVYGSFPGAFDSYKIEYRKDGAIVKEYNDVALMMNHVDHFENFTYQGKKIEKPVDLIRTNETLFVPLVQEIRNYALKANEVLSGGESVASE